MVEKMKKYSFLIYHKTYNEFLESIQKMGVVHIVETQKGIPDSATALRKQLTTSDSLKNNIRSMQRRLAEHKNVTLKPADPSIDGIKALTEYEQLKAKENLLKAQHQNLQKEIAQMFVWGDFDLDIVKKMKDSGRELKFYSCHERDFKPEWKDKINLLEVARTGAIIYFVTITPVGCVEELGAEKVHISDRSLSSLKAALKENIKQEEEIAKQISLFAAEHLNDLLETQRQLLGNIDLNKVHLQVEKRADEKLILLEGWVPEVKEPELVRALEKQDVYYISKPPDKEDATVPVVLKNSKFARLFEPIAKMYDLPNYHEIDLTPFFAPFYLLFFGLCLFDAGYGILLLTAALIARPRVQPSLKPIMSLAALLGASTVVCGAIGGSIFGIQLLDMEWAWLTSFKQYMVDPDKMFTIALVLGCIQILFGMAIKAVGKILRYGWAYSLETWGWLIFLIGCGSLWYFAIQNETLPIDTARYIFYVVLGISGLFILILNTPGRNPLVNFGAGLWSSFQMLTGLIGDVLSYIRLFALGLCGSVMALVFNSLSMNISNEIGIPVISQLVMLIILLLGHSINIFMSGLSSFVHPLRLTFVEFYKNVGFQGRGKAYNPLKIY